MTLRLYSAQTLALLYRRATAFNLKLGLVANELSDQISTPHSMAQVSRLIQFKGASH